MGGKCPSGAGGPSVLHRPADERDIYAWLTGQLDSQASTSKASPQYDHSGGLLVCHGGGVADWDRVQVGLPKTLKTKQLYDPTTIRVLHYESVRKLSIWGDSLPTRC